MYLLTLYFPFFFIFQHLCTFAPFVLLWRNSQLMGNICETSRDPRGPERAADAGQRKGGAAAAVFPPLLLPLLCRELAPALAHAAAVLILRGFPAPRSQWSVGCVGEKTGMAGFGRLALWGKVPNANFPNLWGKLLNLALWGKVVIWKFLNLASYQNG